MIHRVLSAILRAFQRAAPDPWHQQRGRVFQAQLFKCPGCANFEGTLIGPDRKFLEGRCRKPLPVRHGSSGHNATWLLVDEIDYCVDGFVPLGPKEDE